MVRPILIPSRDQRARKRRARGRDQEVVMAGFNVQPKPPKRWMTFVLELVRMLLAGASGFFGGSVAP